jgi:hypothetical protein
MISDVLPLKSAEYPSVEFIESRPVAAANAEEQTIM